MNANQQYAVYGAQLKAISQILMDKRIAVTKVQNTALKHANAIIEGLAYQIRYYPASANLHQSHEIEVNAIISEMINLIKPNHTTEFVALFKTIIRIMTPNTPYHF